MTKGEGPHNLTQYAVQDEGEEGEKHETEKIEGEDQIETWDRNLQLLVCASFHD